MYLGGAFLNGGDGGFARGAVGEAFAEPHPEELDRSMHSKHCSVHIHLCSVQRHLINPRYNLVSGQKNLCGGVVWTLEARFSTAATAASRVALSGKPPQSYTH